MQIAKFAAVLAVFGYGVSLVLPSIVGALPESMQSMIPMLILGLILSIVQLYVITRMLGMHV
jgi:hypothetical protein